MGVFWRKDDKLPNLAPVMLLPWLNFIKTRRKTPNFSYGDISRNILREGIRIARSCNKEEVGRDTPESTLVDIARDLLRLRPAGAAVDETNPCLQARGVAIKIEIK